MKKGLHRDGTDPFSFSFSFSKKGLHRDGTDPFSFSFSFSFSLLLLLLPLLYVPIFRGCHTRLFLEALGEVLGVSETYGICNL